MRYVISFTLFFLVAVSLRSAAETVMPYGDYPLWHSAYGICKQNLSPEEAEIAIGRYFASRGLRAENMRHGNRFTVADVYRDKLLFDKILFDRKTGRIRSIY